MPFRGTKREGTGPISRFPGSEGTCLSRSGFRRSLKREGTPTRRDGPPPGTAGQKPGGPAPREPPAPGQVLRKEPQLSRDTGPCLGPVAGPLTGLPACGAPARGRALCAGQAQPARARTRPRSRQLPPAGAAGEGAAAPARPARPRAPSLTPRAPQPPLPPLPRLPGWGGGDATYLRTSERA